MLTFQAARINYRKTTSVSAPGPVKIGQEKTQENLIIVTTTGPQSAHVLLSLVDLSKIAVDFRATTVVNKFQDPENPETAQDWKETINNIEGQIDVYLNSQEMALINLMV